LVAALTIANYGFPIAQFLFLKNSSVPGYSVEAP
jgi:hypothetical protein